MFDYVILDWGWNILDGFSRMEEMEGRWKEGDEWYMHFFV
jgi:hypothetical protein